MIDLYKTQAPVLNIKAMSDSGEFEGYGSTFGGEPDAYGDIIAAGAFSKSLSEHRARGTMPKMFWQHDPAQPIGKWIEADEDDKGLVLRGKLNMGVQKAREAHALLKEGDIEGLSIGYRIKAYEVDEEAETWTLTEIDLREVSVVSEGANQSATVTDVKARTSLKLLDRLKAGEQLTEREFEGLLKGLGLSNSQAERAVRIHLKGQGEPAKAVNDLEVFLNALR